MVNFHFDNMQYTIKHTYSDVLQALKTTECGLSKCIYYVQEIIDDVSSCVIN